MTQSQKDAFYDKLFAMIVNELKEDEEFLIYVLNNHFGMTKKEVFEAYPKSNMDRRNHYFHHELLLLCYISRTHESS